jgi:hypothetical protein
VRPALWGAGLALVGAVGCGIGIGRDLRSVPPQEVIYDDQCKVQEYYDAMAAGKVLAPAVASSSELQRASDKEPAGGITKFAFEGPAQLDLLHRVLTDNWVKLPEKLMTAPRVELQVKWAEKAGVRRVVTTEDAQISFDDRSTYLPYHICLSELLFGAPLYKTRRELLGLTSPSPEVVTPAPEPAPDGGAAVATTADAAHDH